MTTHEGAGSSTMTCGPLSIGSTTMYSSGWLMITMLSARPVRGREPMSSVAKKASSTPARGRNLVRRGLVVAF